MATDVVLLRGDGIGPEITAAVQKVLEAAGADITWHDAEAGLACLEKGDSIVPQATIEKIREVGVALKAPITTPIGKGSVSANVTMRKRLDLYANVRPVRKLPGVDSPFDGLDMVTFRENTEDVYAQVEYKLTPEMALCKKFITEPASRRIAIAAFEYARKHGRKKVTCVHKANIMKISDGLFLDTFRKVAADYPDIEHDDVIVDACCMQLVRYWTRFDVICTENLYGDIISDLAAGLMGGLGVAPAANYGGSCAIFEAVHGSAPDIAGQDKANPLALLLSAELMLEHLEQRDAAAKVRKAYEAVLSGDQAKLTGDLGGSAGTTAFTETLIGAM